MKFNKIQGTLVAIAAAGLFAGCAQKAGTGSGGTCGGDRSAASDANSCKGHGDACKGDSCKAKCEQKDKGGNFCNSKDGCGAP